jgi:hypothetical protein
MNKFLLISVAGLAHRIGGQYSTTCGPILGLTLALRKERIVFDMRNGIITQLP